MLFSGEKSLNVEVANIEQQKGGSDCGLFAIANATALCFGLDPVCLSWSQTHMRQHFLQCLDNKSMEVFPHIAVGRDTKPPILKQFLIPLHCYCRQPEGPDAMVECGTCLEWYHFSCEGIPPSQQQLFIDDHHLDFTCRRCRNLLLSV